MGNNIFSKKLIIITLGMGIFLVIFGLFYFLFYKPSENEKATINAADKYLHSKYSNIKFVAQGAGTDFFSNFGDKNYTVYYIAEVNNKKVHFLVSFDLQGQNPTDTLAQDYLRLDIVEKIKGFIAPNPADVSINGDYITDERLLTKISEYTPNVRGAFFNVFIKNKEVTTRRDFVNQAAILSQKIYEKDSNAVQIEFEGQTNKEVMRVRIMREDLKKSPDELVSEISLTTKK